VCRTSPRVHLEGEGLARGERRARRVARERQDVAHLVTGAGMVGGEEGGRFVVADIDILAEDCFGAEYLSAEGAAAAAGEVVRWGGEDGSRCGREARGPDAADDPPIAGEIARMSRTLMTGHYPTKYIMSSVNLRATGPMTSDLVANRLDTRACLRRSP